MAGALTNVVKHAQAERAEVRAFVKDETLHLEVRDNGVGGANPLGQGLIGLSDRVTALQGRLSIQSPAQGGTILAATLPSTPNNTPDSVFAASAADGTQLGVALWHELRCNAAGCLCQRGGSIRQINPLG